MRKIRKFFLILLIFIISVCCLSGCKKSELDKDNPVTLTLWHVYGEQSDSPMNRLIDEFNSTVGMEKADTIISINTDPDAPINKLANYVIIGDARETVTKLIEKFSTKK